MPKPRVALLINFIAPSRVGLYERLAGSLDLTILHGDVERNRDSWKSLKVNGARNKRIAGWQLSFNRRERGEVFDHWFVHIEPGYITELIQERPDAVITDEMGFRTLVGLAYGTCFRKPVWVWWGGTSRTESHVGWFRKLVRRIVARWASHWISYGQTSTEYLQSLGIPRQRILQAQNCVDESWYSSQGESKVNVQPRPVLLHVGQMVARKGIAEFLQAARRLQEEGLNFSIVLVGGGRDSAKLQLLAVDLRLDNVRFCPPQPAKSMPGFYHSADVLIFPTMKDVWGLVANEAILSGVPVLCSKYAGCAPELFDGETIFDPANEKEFVEALRRAVAGQLPRTDKARLRSSAEVGDIIANAILESCTSPRPKVPKVKADPISHFVPKN